MNGNGRPEKQNTTTMKPTKTELEERGNEARERAHRFLELRHRRRPIQHPMAWAVFALLVTGMPGVHRANALELAILMGMDSGPRGRSWVKVCEDLIDELPLSDPDLFERVEHPAGNVLLSVVRPDEKP